MIITHYGASTWDRQTDMDGSQHCLMLPTVGRGYNNMAGLTQIVLPPVLNNFKFKKIVNGCLQFIILVVDSTDRERLGISKEELYRMLACEVRQRFFSCLVGSLA